MIVRIAINRGSCIVAGSLLNKPGSIINRCYPGLTLVSHRYKATQKSAEEEIDLDAPIKFSTSRAATWKSRETYSGKQTEVNKRPWYEPYIVSVSMAVFLLYFCYFREESGVDDKFSQTLYDHIAGLEEKQLELSLQHNEQTGRDTEAIKNRLAELRSNKLVETDAASSKG